MRSTVKQLAIAIPIALIIASCDGDRVRDFAKALFLSPELPLSRPDSRASNIEGIKTKPEGIFTKPSSHER